MTEEAVSKKRFRHISDYGLGKDHDDQLVGLMIRIIHHAVRVLAFLMTFVILWGIIDVVWTLYQNISTPPYFLLNINDILATFGAFLAVLIAIEIFVNITMYLRDDVIHVKLVMATALMAIARKVIIFDYSTHSPHHVWATGVVIAALSLGYWLISLKSGRES